MKIIKTRFKKIGISIKTCLKKFEDSELDNNKGFWRLWLRFGYAINIFFGLGFFILPMFGYDASLLPYVSGILIGIYVCKEAHEKIQRIEEREEKEALEQRRLQYKNKP